VYEALKPLKDTLNPDLIVGHSGFGSTLFLPELFPGVPILNYFEYYYRAYHSDLDYRPDWPVLEYDRLRSRARNAMILLDLANCQAGYTPTQYQKSLFPIEFQPKLEVIHDGIDTQFWQPQVSPSRQIGDLRLPANALLVTYVARGLEAMRGFDIFMHIAKRLCEINPQVRCLVVGSDEVFYGGDLKHINALSFKEYVLAQGNYDLERIHFLGRVPPDMLVQILSLSDLHIYLTVPFVLSWSLLNAMSCKCTVLASATPPVLEVISHGKNGLLCDFFDEEGFVQQAQQVLSDPAAYRKKLGQTARQTVLDTYSQEVTLPRIKAFYNRHVSARN